MTDLIVAIVMALRMLFGDGDYTRQAQEIYDQGKYKEITPGVVIIDTDEL